IALNKKYIQIGESNDIKLVIKEIASTSAVQIVIEVTLIYNNLFINNKQDGYMKARAKRIMKVEINQSVAQFSEPKSPFRLNPVIYHEFIVSTLELCSKRFPLRVLTDELIMEIKKKLVELLNKRIYSHLRNKVC
ncbi:9132_t:CDS:2, partial [Diversispora eburnea]